MGESHRRLEPFAETQDNLSHSGVKGMKWGVRNAETLRKYASGSRNGTKKVGFDKIKASAARGAGRMGKAAVSGGKKAGSFVATKAKGAVSTKLQKRRTEREVERMMDSAGLKRKRQREEFKRTRAKTLASHDPETVFKGAHTLTDDELSAKIARINKESSLLSAAADRKTKASQAEQARQLAEQARQKAKQATVKGRIVDAAINTVSNSVTNAGREATQRALDAYFPKPDKNKDKNKNADKIAKGLDDVASAIRNSSSSSDSSKEKQKKQHDEVEAVISRSADAVNDLASLRKQTSAYNYKKQPSNDLGYYAYGKPKRRRK